MSSTPSPSQKISWSQSGETRSAELPLEAVVHQNGENVTSLVLMMHGFGDNAQNFWGVADELKLPGTLTLCLNAPLSHPQLAAHGGKMWFDLFSEPWEALRNGSEKVKQTAKIIQEITGVPQSRTAYLGFSQGGCMSLISGLGSDTPPAAVVSLSGFFMGSHTFVQNPTEAHLKTPIMLAHGTHDQVVLPTWFHETQAQLKLKKFENLQTQTYPVEHSLHPQEMIDIKKFLQEAL